MDTETLSQRLAHHVVVRPDLTDELRDWMRVLLFDFVAVTVRGADRDSAIAARAAVTTARERTEATPAAILGTSLWAEPADAALVNGITSHGLELDDTHEGASHHPGVAIMPAALALAQGGSFSYDEVLSAIVVGYDVMCALGELVTARESYARGFHPTAITGVLGSAAAASVLLGLDEVQTTHALGIAANSAAGSLEFLADGSWTKRLNAGHAASTGIRSARLARAGFTAPSTAFEGRDGFLRQYGNGRADPSTLTLEFGRGARETSIKFYPCCRYMHGAIDLLVDLHAEIGAPAQDEIEGIDVAVITAGAALVSDPPERKLVVTTPVDAQFNMPYGAALALTTGRASVDQFDDAPELAAGLLGVMRKVHCYESPAVEAAFPAEWQAEVTVRMTDGRSFARRESAFRGSPGDPATRAMVVAKGRELIDAEAADRAEAAVFDASADGPFTLPDLSR